MNYWTESETEFIRNNYKTMGNIELSKSIGRSIGSVQKKLICIGCKRTKDELKALSRLNTGNFKKGCKPWNKGKHKSRFKKGNTINTKNDGDITTRTKEGRKVKYIRLEMCKWERYNNYLWKQKHGFIPDGKFVVEKNGINNEDVKSVYDLELLDKSEMMKRAHSSRRKASLPKATKIDKLEKMIGRLYLYIYRYHRIKSYHLDGNDVVIETDAREIRIDKTKLAHEITLFLPVDSSDSSGYKRSSDYKNQVSVD